MTRIKWLLPLVAFAIMFAAVGQTQEKKIVMTHVKYDGLKQEVLKHRGKVVIVDFWATWCVNCMKAFPTFIEMQKKYGDQGLVIISVSLDSTEEQETVDNANRFLNKQNSPFRNLLLDEPSDVWKKKLDSGSLPLYYVFDR